MDYRKKFEDRLINERQNYFELVEFTNTKEIAKFYHKKCGNYFYKVPHEFIKTRYDHIYNNDKCPICSKETFSNKYTLDKSNSLLNKYTNGNIIIIDDYNGFNSKCKVKCNTCKKEFFAVPRTIIQNITEYTKTTRNGCRYCSKK